MTKQLYYYRLREQSERNMHEKEIKNYLGIGIVRATHVRSCDDPILFTIPHFVQLILILLAVNVAQSFVYFHMRSQI